MFYVTVSSLFSCKELSDEIEFSNYNIGVRDRRMNSYCGRNQVNVFQNPISTVRTSFVTLVEYFPHPQVNRTLRNSRFKPLTSGGPFFRVTFRSDSKYEATGFEAFYQFVAKPGKVFRVPENDK